VLEVLKVINPEHRRVDQGFWWRTSRAVIARCNSAVADVAKLVVGRVDDDIRELTDGHEADLSGHDTSRGRLCDHDATALGLQGEASVKGLRRRLEGSRPETGRNVRGMTAARARQKRKSSDVRCLELRRDSNPQPAAHKRRWAHMLGYGGHCLTKGQLYSATVAAPRAARRTWTATRRHGPTVLLDRDGRLISPAGAVPVADWRYQGRGYTIYGDAWLAGHMAAQYREMRRIRRQELASGRR
jgi:hypothetical protein